MTCAGSGRPPVTCSKNSGISSTPSGLPWARSRIAFFVEVKWYSRARARFSPSSAALLRHGVGRRFLLHEPGQRFHVIDRGFRQNAVTKVKDVARASGGATKNIVSTQFHLFPPGKQEHGIKIPLHG